MKMGNNINTDFKQLKTILGYLRQGKLWASLKILEEWLVDLGWYDLKIYVEEIKSDYGLMEGYWAKGLKDEQFNSLYDNMIKATYGIVLFMTIRCFDFKNGMLTGLWKKENTLKIKDWSWSSVKQRLESFVGNVALAEFEAGNTKGLDSNNVKTIYKEHQDYMKLLFKRVVASGMLRKSEAEEVEGLLLSPTIDSKDQQLIAAALSVSSLRVFDINKFTMLSKVYMNSEDENVKQWALIGWALSIGLNMHYIFNEQKELVDQMLEDESVRNEIEELQLQVINCMEASNDAKEIEEQFSDSFMSEIRNSRMDVLSFLDLDHTDDILGKGDNERRIEELEDKFAKIAEKTKQGRDVFYGTFAQIRHYYPFFDEPSNWFVPFFEQHPDIQISISDKEKYGKIFGMIHTGQMCESDKYSFLLATKTILDKIPADAMKMIDSINLYTEEELKSLEGSQATRTRLNHLQVMYRFFTQYKYKSSFVSPFDDKPDSNETRPDIGPLFVINPLMAGKMERFLLSLVSIIDKHKLPFRHVQDIFKTIGINKKDYRYNMVYAATALRHGRLPLSDYTVKDAFTNALLANSESLGAAKGLARELFREGNFKEAFDFFQRLLEDNEDDMSLALSMAACLNNMGNNSEASEVLYELYYEHPEDVSVRRMLARVLMELGRTEKALNLLETLQAEGKAEKSDFKNLLLCKWINRKEMDQVAEGFCQLCKGNSKTGWGDAYEECFYEFNGKFSKWVDKKDEELLESHGIGRNEVEVMKAAALNHLRKKE